MSQKPLLDVETILTDPVTPTLPFSAEEEAEAAEIVEQVLSAPDTATIPESPGTLYVMALRLGEQMTGDNFGLAAAYFERLREASRVEFAVLALKLAVAREGYLPQETPGGDDQQPLKIVQSEAYVELALGPIGQIIAGE